ncbi:MAG TPA: TlpA disulfide reductase family protein [Blastocatellia bacterium]|nr:TlpA disulfide reductase family protein [Blastocatellia bacterium]
MRKNNILASLLILALIALTANGAGELVRLVRLKLSAGDLASAASAVEDYKEKNGVDAEYLDAVGWLARGAEMLRQPDAAAAYVAELRREIREEKPDTLSPLGAAIEVEGKLRAAREGRGSALRFLEEEFARARDVALRSRIRRTINVLSLEGQPAPDYNKADFVGAEPPSLAALKGKPALLFLWAHWCGDCKAQAGMLGRIIRKYRAQGLVVIAPTRYYGTGADNKPAKPDEEKAHMAKVWAEFYAGLEGVAIPIDTDAMVRYGVSATPTYALIDRKGVVRFYSPTRLSEAELSRRIEAVLGEKP